MDKEFWRVEIHSKKYTADLHVYFVYANSAKTAERAAMKLAKQDDVKNPYTYSASFHGYIRQ